MKPVVCHITVSGQPVCAIPFGVWQARFPGIQQQCGHLTLAAGRARVRELQRATWGRLVIKAVRGACQEGL